MRRIGFSTGALALSDFRRGLSILKSKGIRGVELSALRESELGPLVAALDSLSLKSFEYVSLHAPSRFERANQNEILGLLRSVAERGLPIILHPDAIWNPAAWDPFGDLILIENMDKRNAAGRTASELSKIFRGLPRARLCFDVGHCRQIDPTMNESYLILKQFGDRMAQVHVSEVNSRNTHDPLSVASILAFEKIAYLIPDDMPLIIESRVQVSDIELEIVKTRLALPSGRSDGSRKRELRTTSEAGI